MTELVLGLAFLVWSILGIVGLFPTCLAAIAVIVLGVILLFHSVHVALPYSDRLYEAGATNQINGRTFVKR